jgi:SAM-dependent methyltransferase
VRSAAPAEGVPPLSDQIHAAPGRPTRTPAAADSDPASTVAPLVCPLDLVDFGRPRPEELRCPFGHGFAVIQGTPDLAVVEGEVTHVHHRPDRRLLAFASYDDQRHIGPRFTPRSTLWRRIRCLREVERSARFYRRTIPRAYARLDVEAPDRPPVPPADRFSQIFGPGLYAHELLKRLEKELFWDRLQLLRPAYEIGTSDGNASRYFFEGRAIDFGSEYLLDELIRSRIPHDRRFSANIKFLPFRDGSLETVLCSQTITCIYASILAVLTEINRVLRPGGRLLFTCHGPAYLRGLPPGGWSEMRLSALECLRRNEQRSSYMAHLYTGDEWRQILAATGFELAETRGILSTDLARYSQLFYFAESHGPNVFRERYRQGRLGAIVRLFFGGGRAHRNCDAKYRDIMQRVLAHELARNSNAEFDNRRYLDAGIVAVKRASMSPPVVRLGPRFTVGS